MARKSFLPEEELIEARNLLRAPSQCPNGDLDVRIDSSVASFSRWLGEKLLRLLEAHPLWYSSHPILLGSWSRGELCLNSDVDLLFLGEDETVKNLVDHFTRAGLKIRYRVPMDRNDWRVGVDHWDLLSLFSAVPVTETGKQELASQRELIFSSKGLKTFLREIQKEKRERALRFDSIQNFLEPNVKYGPGALRDIYQAQLVMELFPERCKNLDHEKKLLNYYLELFLLVRNWLHLFGSGRDVLSGPDQHSLYPWLGFDSLASFMREIQKGLSRVSFYSEWITSNRWNAEVKTLSLRGMIKALQEHPQIAAEHEVRRKMDLLGQKELTWKKRGLSLRSLANRNSQESLILSVFRSRFIDKLIPSFKNLIGYVQHDQYHRFTADVHIQQACREVKRCQAKPNRLRAVRKVAQKLKASDWEILFWTALYHDLAKGQKSDQEHGEISESWVFQDFKRFGFSRSFTEEVAWLVRNHLELSVAAFRKNPSDPETWNHLSSIGMTPLRLKRLAVFTGIDILATNPEAWTDWKSKLICQLVDRMNEGQTRNYLKLKELLNKKLEEELSAQLCQDLDLGLIAELSPQVLAKDLFQSAEFHESNCRIYAHSKHKFWVRMQCPDEPGVLARFVGALTGAGCSIHFASVLSSPILGAYDWFLVESSRSRESLLKILKLSDTPKKEVPRKLSQKGVFEKIEIVSESSEELLIVFRGRDQKGMLFAATSELYALGVNIISARVHTWGKEVEDIFSLHRVPDSNKLLSELRSRLGQ